MNCYEHEECEYNAQPRCCLPPGQSCPHGIERERPHTNADRIRAMPINTLARLFTHAVADGCPPDMDWECQKDTDGWDGCDKCWERWLTQPATEEG